MSEISQFGKKAMQFGTGIAKKSNKSKFGSNRQAKGDSEYILARHLKLI